MKSWWRRRALEKRRKLVLALCEVVLPVIPQLNHLEFAERIAGDLDDFLKEFPPALAVGFRFNLVVFKYAGCLHWRYHKPFTRLSLEKKQRYCEGWNHSGIYPIRELFKGIKGLLLLHYYDYPEVRAEIGYPIEKHRDKKIRERKKVAGKKFKVQYDS